MIYSFDMDETLCTNAARRERWREYASPCSLAESVIDGIMNDVEEDAPLPLVHLAQRICLLAPVVIVSGRPNSCLVPTRRWLIRHGIAAVDVILRERGQTSTNGAEWKKNALMRLVLRLGDDVIHFDDDPGLRVGGRVCLARMDGTSHVG
jgi:hypothetical protein